MSTTYKTHAKATSDLIVFLCILKALSGRSFHGFNLDAYLIKMGRIPLTPHYANSFKGILLLEKMLRNMNE